MRKPQFDRMSKKALIDRLVKVEKQLNRASAGHRSAPVLKRSSVKNSEVAEFFDPTQDLEGTNLPLPVLSSGTGVKFVSESHYTILDRDGRIRRLYRVEKDIEGNAGNPVFSEGALYEINHQAEVTSVDGHPDISSESDQTELICRFKPNGTLTYVNEAYCRYFGCEKDDFQDRNILLSISETDRAKVYSRLTGLRPERPVDTLEYRVVTAFGDILWNQWTYRALFDDSGNILEYRSVGRDITFRKYTQDVLEKRAAVLEAVTYAAEAFLKSSTWRDRIERILERIGAAMRASHVFLCENHVGKGGGITVLRSYEWISPRTLSAGHRKKFLSDAKLAVRFSEWVYAKSEGRPIYGSIGSFPEQILGELKMDMQLSIAVVPILLGERWWGFIGFADYTGDIQWDEDEVAPLGTASEILGAAIEREEKDRNLNETQEALRKNEALLEGILQAAPIGVGMVHERVIGWVNEGMTVLTGYGGDDLRGKSARILYPDDEEFERVAREKYAEIETRGKGAVETRWRRKDGTVIYVHLSSAPIDPANLSTGVVFTALDITALKKAANILLFAKEDLEKQVAVQTRELDVANMLLRIELEEHRKTEEALATSEKIYRAVVEDQTELICRFRSDGTLSFVNDAFCRFFRMEREGLMGTKYRPILPEDWPIVNTALRSLTPGSPMTHFEIRVECPDRKLCWTHWTMHAVYDDARNAVEFQAVGRDIAERKQSEIQIRESRNMLRSVFDGISDPLVMVQEDMTVIMLNRSALNFLGTSQYKEAIGTSCIDAFRGRYGQEEVNLVLAAIAEQEAARYELATRGDTTRYEEVIVYPVRAGGEGSHMAIIRVTDRTRQRLMERELIQSEKLASLGLLISGIVHEINNPNNFISFNIPILRDYIQDILPVLDEYAARTPEYEVQGMPYAEFRTDVTKLLDNIEHGSTRINATVGKLKEFSRKKSEKGARPILPTSVVERAIAICHTQIRKTVKTFDVEVQQDMSEMVTDPDAIEQPLINLLVNAAQAADKPDSRIVLRIRQEPFGKWLALEVEDNGCGMDAKTAFRIFDPFFTTKEEGLGTGLGLYISKNLIESAGGSITVESEIGQGTTFHVILPDLTPPDHREQPSKQKEVDS